MLLNILMSSILYLVFLGFGNIMMFLDSNAYWLLLPYMLVLLLSTRMYHENCKTMEIKDFIFALLIVAIDMIIYNTLHFPITVDIFSYLYLATIVPYLSYATTIRFKSLM